MLNKKTVIACGLGLILGVVISPVMWLTYYDPLLKTMSPLCSYNTLQSSPLDKKSTQGNISPLDWFRGKVEEAPNEVKVRGQNFARTPDELRKFNLTVSNYTVTPSGDPKVRYRKLSYEVAPRNILFVGVVTAEKYLNTRAVAINNTWGRDLPNLIYFSSHPNKTSIKLPIISLPGVNDTVYPPQRKVYHMLKYMHDNFIDDYDFFMRSDDDVYVKTDLLLEILQNINPAQDIYMGCPGFGRPDDQSRIKLEGGEHYCMGGPGVIFSRSALRKLAPHLDTCLKVGSFFFST